MAKNLLMNKIDAPGRSSSSLLFAANVCSVALDMTGGATSRLVVLQGSCQSTGRKCASSLHPNDLKVKRTLSTCMIDVQTNLCLSLQCLNYLDTKSSETGLNTIFMAQSRHWR